MDLKLLTIIFLVISVPISATDTEDKISIFMVKEGDTLEWEIVHNYESTGSMGEYSFKLKYEITEVNSTLNRIQGTQNKEFISGDQETFTRLHGDDLSNTMIIVGPIINGIELVERPIEVLNPNYWNGIKSVYSDDMMQNYTTVWMEDYYFRNVTEYFEDDHSSYKFGRSFEWSINNIWGNMSSIYFKYDFTYRKSDGIMSEHQYSRQQGDIIISYSISLVKKNYIPIPLYSSPIFTISILMIIVVVIIYIIIRNRKTSNQ